MAGKLRADLPDPVAEGDHVPETLPGEHVQVLGLLPGQVDAVPGYHPPTLHQPALMDLAQARCGDSPSPRIP